MPFKYNIDGSTAYHSRDIGGQNLTPDSRGARDPRGCPLPFSSPRGSLLLPRGGGEQKSRFAACIAVTDDLD